ncbi:MAG: Ig-like domain-containing protein, partial [Treponema sp.]|nr:Ig-like domain-containing protein [Treponema sp.]
LYLPPDIDSYTITVPMPPQNPSGLAKIRFQNNFTESIIVHARKENTYGPVGVFDGTRAANERNSVILPKEAASFIIPAARYEITVGDTQGDVLREYEAFYFPAAFDEYIFELDPHDREKVDASIRASGGATGVQGRIALDQKSEIVFTKPMIKALVEANISFYQTGKKKERIPVQLAWIRNDTVLTVQPDGYLSPDTEYCISLDLDSRDRRGNSLAEAKEWIFTTHNVFKPLPLVSRVSTRSSMDEILCEWQGVFNADGYEVRVYSGNEIIQIQDIGKSTSHRFIRSALEADIKYAIIPYKKIEGKKAYSADALEMEASVAYFENNARSQPQNMRTYSIERDDSVGAKLVKLLRERDFIKTASNPAYIVILNVPQDRNERKRGHAIDIDSIIDIEILLSSDRSSVYHYNSKIDRVTGSTKDPAGAERNVAEKIINDLENNFLEDFDEKFLY